MGIETFKIILETLKWPITVIGSILVLKKPIAELINGITDFNLGGRHGLTARVGSSKICCDNELNTRLSTEYSINTNYFSGKKHGKVTFNYSNNNGIYTIGEGEYRFDTMWTKASKQSIHYYNDQPTIKTVRLAKDFSALDKVIPTNYDSSSRARTADIGQIAIFENVHNHYLLAKIIEIKDDSRGDENDELTFEYIIL